MLSMMLHTTLHMEKSQSMFFFLSGFSFMNICESQDCIGSHFLNSSLPLSPVSQTLRHQLDDNCIESSHLHIARSQTRTRNLWFLSTIYSNFYFGPVNFLIITGSAAGCCKYGANIAQISLTLHSKNLGPTLNKKTILYRTVAILSNN